jgi:hypothetical protein
MKKTVIGKVRSIATVGTVVGFDSDTTKRPYSAN